MVIIVSVLISCMEKKYHRFMIRGNNICNDDVVGVMKLVLNNYSN